LAQNFATPLRAAGIEVKVDSFFADEERDPATTRWDVSTPLKDIMTK
jgi:3-deoxy-D-manno-octulosonic acid (KDO) 8-phosphate synthase